LAGGGAEGEEETLAILGCPRPPASYNNPMRLPVLLLLLALALAPALRAQGFEDPVAPAAPAAPGRVLPRPAEADPGFGRLRSISYFFTDVKTSENRPEDGDLRAELRDLIELELRRAGMTPRDLPTINPDASAPQLLIEIRFDRGLGRYSAVVAVSVRDEATVRRNGQPVMAETYRAERPAAGTSDALLTRDIKNRSRELLSELFDGMSKAKTGGSR